MGNQPKPRYREFTQNTRKVERSAFGKLLHEEFLTPHKITQRRLSEVSGVAAEDISRMVTGERYPYDPTLYNNLYALFNALAELGVPLTDDQVSNILQVKEIHARLSDKRQEELIDALKDDGVVKVAYQTTQQEADALYHPAVLVPSIPEPPILDEEPPVIDNLPFQPNPFFTGREDHLKQIREKLQETGTAAITQPVSISGLGGIGKTELALAYAHSFYPNVYRVVLWVDADTPTLQTSYANLAEVLKLPERDEQKLYRRKLAIKDWLKEHTNWLLIMDNADDLPLAESFLPSQPLGHVVFTTQSQIIDTIPTQIEIDAMEPDEGLRFLLRRSGKLQDDAADMREAASQVVELLGGHPLALDQAGAYIEETKVSFTDYLNRYRSARPNLLKRRGGRVRKHSEHPDHRRHPEPVAATLNLSFTMACQQHPLAADILNFCAFLHPDAIPEELFHHDDSFKYDMTEFDEAIAALHRYSLIRRNIQEKTLSMHRLVQAVLIDAMSPDHQKQWRERVVRALNAAFPLSMEFKHWGQGDRLLSHALLCATWTEDELTPTVGLAVLFHKLGIYLYELGRYLEAEQLLSRALSIYKHHLGVEHPATVGARNDLDTIYTYDARNEWLSIWEDELGGAEHPDTALLLYGLARAFHDLGQRGGAESLYRRALRIQKRQLGATDRHTQTTRMYYANFLRSIGRDAEAAALEANEEPPV